MTWRYVTLLAEKVSHLSKRYTNICKCIYNWDVYSYGTKLHTYGTRCQENTGLRPVFPWRIWCSEIQKNAKYFFGKCLFCQVARMENLQLSQVHTTSYEFQTSNENFHFATFQYKHNCKNSILGWILKFGVSRLKVWHKTRKCDIKNVIQRYANIYIIGTLDHVWCHIPTYDPKLCHTFG